MKKFGTLLILLIPVMLFGNIIRGGPGDRVMGFAPGDTLIDTLLVTVRIPSRIGIFLDGDMEFDLGNPAVTYPPVAFPGYYDPTLVGGGNADGIELQVFSNSNVLTWQLETSGSGDFTGSVLLDQLWYAPDGTANPADGAAPGLPWVAFTNTFVNLASGGQTLGWQNLPQDYVFQAEIDDQPTPGATVIIYYRLYAQ